jgi:hypothetical protein
VGQTFKCYFDPSPITISVGGEQFTGTVKGDATYRITRVQNYDPTIPDSRNSISYVPVAVSATSDIPGFGTITTSLDQSVPAPESSTTSINPGPEAYPAVASMDYPANGTVDDQIYASIGIVSFYSDNVNSTFPFVQERFEIRQSVTFATPSGGEGFTLDQISSTFNGCDETAN